MTAPIPHAYSRQFLTVLRARLQDKRLKPEIAALYRRAVAKIEQELGQ